MKEFQVVYDHNGYTLPAGNPIWYKDKFVAERVCIHRQNETWHQDDLLYLMARETGEADTDEPNRFYKGKILWSKDKLDWDAIEVGEYVTEETADNLINCLPPACMRSDCLQMGEPQTCRYDEARDKWRNTYLTLKRVAEGIYEYCGDCFLGENKQRGKEMQYV